MLRSHDPQLAKNKRLAILADGDLVVLSFAREHPDPPGM